MDQWSSPFEHIIPFSKLVGISDGLSLVGISDDTLRFSQTNLCFFYKQNSEIKFLTN